MDPAALEQVINKVVEKAMQARVQEQPEMDDLIVFSETKEMGVENPHNLQAIEQAQQVTPARIGIGRTGTRLRTKSYLQFRIDHAAAQDAVTKEVSSQFLTQLGLPKLQSKATSMQQFLMDLDAGRKLSVRSQEWLEKYAEKGRQVQLIVSDGLSSSAVEANIADLLPAFMQGLQLKNISIGTPIYVERSRVWLQDHVASIVDCDVVISLIGERPGLATAESISAYLIYRPNEHTVEADRTVISNIHKGGLSPLEAGAHLADLIEQMLKHKKSGVKLATIQKNATCK